MSDSITIICTVAGVIIAFVTYYHSYLKEPKEDKAHLIHKFQFAKEMNHNLIEELTKFASENNLWEEIFMQGLTFRRSIAELNKARTLIFNEENEKLLQSSKPNKRSVNDMLKSLEIQINAHSQIKTELNFYWKKY